MTGHDIYVPLCLQIYRACEIRGRIAYKRSGGSRLITQNDHWKSQIRHALYTSERFVRCAMYVGCLCVTGFSPACCFSTYVCRAVWPYNMPGMPACRQLSYDVVWNVSCMADWVASPTWTITDMLRVRDLALLVQSLRGRRLLDSVQKLYEAGAWDH